MKRALLTFATATFAAPGAPAPAVEYGRDILPIFRQKCFKCHGEGKDKGSVRLDLEHIKGEIDFTVKPGNPEKSSLFDSITTEERDLKMPPAGKGTPLTDREVRKVRDWIQGGAQIGTEKHVAKSDEKKPAPPTVVESPAPVTGQWTNHAGKTITASALRVEGDKVVFRLPDGREVPYPIANLSPESQAKVRAFASGGAGAE